MANKKTNFFKSVVVTNLPALAALILMAVALRITLKFNVVLSFIVLLVVYFFLGVTIELILDKLQVRKKKNELFKKYTADEVSDEETESAGFSLDELLRSVSDSRTEAEAPAPEPVVEKPLETAEDFENPETVLEDESHEAEEEREEIPAVPVEAVSEADNELLNSLTTGGFDLESTEEEIHEPAAEDVPETDTQTTEDVPPVEAVSEEKKEEDDFLNMTVSDLNGTESAAPSEDIDLLFKDLFTSEEKEEQASPKEEQAPDMPEAEAEKPSEDKVSFDTDIVREVLREVNEDDQSARVQAQKEKADTGAKKSIFENDGFDVDFEPAGQPETKKSILFESIPDTEDDFDFLPYEDNPAASTPPAQKGKVRVDPKKIDELYTITRDRKEGGSIFGRRKKK